MRVVATATTNASTKKKDPPVQKKPPKVLTDQERPTKELRRWRDNCVAQLRLSKYEREGHRDDATLESRKSELDAELARRAANTQAVAEAHARLEKVQLAVNTVAEMTSSIRKPSEANALVAKLTEMANQLTEAARLASDSAAYVETLLRKGSPVPVEATSPTHDNGAQGQEAPPAQPNTQKEPSTKRTLSGSQTPDRLHG